MRPQKLILNAFGPFKSRTEIDFKAAGGSGIFLITGETGSGKTTIFDAITFALYGKASGENRLAGTLKSHHSKAEDKCYIELEFSVRDESYTVRRSPFQHGLKRDGSLKDIGEKAELILPSGEVISGKNAVNDKITGIIGLNYNQFKQTTMLAQGEFRRFIEANSTEKQQILSRIFSKDEYNDLTDFLAAKEAKTSADIKDLQERKAEAVKELAALGFADLSGESAVYMPFEDLEAIVRAGLDILSAENKKNSEEIDDLLNLKKDYDTEKAAKLNENIAKYNALLKENAELSDQKTDYRRLEKELELIENAAAVYEFERGLISAQDSRLELEAGINRLVKSEEALKRQAQVLGGEYERLPDIREEIIKRALECEKIYTEIEKLKGLKEKEAELKTLKCDIAQKENTIEEISYAVELLYAKNEAEKLKDGIQCIKKLEQLTGRKAEIERQYEGVSTEYKKLYAEHLKHEISIIAESLADGAPCPVCGSENHPAPATEKAEAVPAELVDKLRSRADELAAEIKELALNAEILLVRAEKTLDLLNFPKEELSPLCILEAGERLQKALEDLRRGFNEKPQYKNSAYLKAEAGELEKLLPDHKAALMELKLNAQKLEEFIKENTPLRQYSLLMRDYEDKKSEKEALELKARSTEQAYLEGKSKLDKISSEIMVSKNNLEATGKNIENLKAELNKRIATAGFLDYNTYKSLLARKDEKADILAKTTGYKERMLFVRAGLESLESEVRGKALIDLEDLKQKNRDIDDRIKSLESNKMDFNIKIHSIKESLKRLEETQDSFDKNARIYRDLKELAFLAKGSVSPFVSFERYILSSYFDDILKVANIHLQKLTGFRYKLVRKNVSSVRTAGLDIEIIDSYTGFKRDAGTLSGGEGFQVSLSLALGLSDVVQIYAGGVSVETMFIDEGFGTLDNKSLEKVMASLASLENTGRLVGIISHVELLKDFIPAKLVITSTKGGSTAKFTGI